MDKIKGIWDKIWDGMFTKIDSVLGKIKGVVEDVFGFITGIIEKASAALGGLFGDASAAAASAANTPEAAPATYSARMSSFPNIPAAPIPKLATGAVIPANREFLAILGDQKHGTNIEAPLSTIEEAVGRAIDKRGDIGGVKEITIKVPVEIDGRVLFELMKKLDLEQYKRTGRPSFQI